MLIADILAPTHNDKARKGLHAAVNATGNTITAIETSAPSFAISMQLAGALKKNRYDAVIVHTNRQAVAAISAKIIAEKSNSGYAIIYQPMRCENTPRNIPSEVIDKTALWIFEDAAMQQQYTRLGVHPQKSAILPPTSFDTGQTPSTITPAEYDGNTPLNLVWLGEITDYTLLRNAVDAIRQLPEATIRFSVCGTGKARHIMPIVRNARADNHHTYIWKGNEYDAEQELAHAHVIIAERPYVSAVQIDGMRSGIPVYEAVDTSELRDSLTLIVANPEALHAAGEAARQAYQDTYNPLFHVKHLVELIAETTK